MSARSLLGSLPAQPADQRVAALKRILPLPTAQRALRQTGHAARHGPAWPFGLVVRLVLGIGLFARDSYRVLFERLQPFVPGCTPLSNTLTAARLARGLLPLRLLAQAVVKPLCEPDTPGAFYRALRLMASDGFVLDLPDTRADARAFGRPAADDAAGRPGVRGGGAGGVVPPAVGGGVEHRRAEDAPAGAAGAAEQDPPRGWCKRSRG